jgi:hypothetical protein
MRADDNRLLAQNIGAGVARSLVQPTGDVAARDPRNASAAPDMPPRLVDRGTTRTTYCPAARRRNQSGRRPAQHRGIAAIAPSARHCPPEISIKFAATPCPRRRAPTRVWRAQPRRDVEPAFSSPLSDPDARRLAMVELLPKNIGA